jgi:hypothetical protein
MAHESTTPERVWRIRFAVSMWVCGIVAIQCIPIYPMSPEFWAERASMLPNGIHWAWLGTFFCSLASVICSVFLFCLPRFMDKVGSLFALLTVGLWPGFAALYWWYYFATI